MQSLTSPQRLIVKRCTRPQSLRELMRAVGVTHRAHFRSTHLEPLLQEGVVEMTNPENPQASNQKYRLTERGVAVQKELLRTPSTQDEPE